MIPLTSIDLVPTTKTSAHDHRELLCKAHKGPLYKAPSAASALEDPQLVDRFGQLFI